MLELMQMRSLLPENESNFEHGDPNQMIEAPQDFCGTW